MGAVAATKCCIERDAPENAQWQQRVQNLEVENRRLRGKIQKLRSAGQSLNRKVQFEGAGDDSPRSPFSLNSPNFFDGLDARKGGADGQYIELILQEFSPAFRHHIEDRILRGSVEVELKRRVWDQLRFLRVTMGKGAPWTSGTSVRRKETTGRDHVLELSVDVMFEGEDVELWMEIDTDRQAQVDKIMVYGTLILELRTTLNHVPGFWGVTMCFLNRPDVRVSFIGPFGTLTDKIAIAREVIEDHLSSELVAPHRVAMSLSTALPASDLRAQVPDGLLSLRLRCVTQPCPKNEPEDRQEQKAFEAPPATDRGQTSITAVIAVGVETWIPPSARMINVEKEGQRANFDLPHHFVVDSSHGQVVLASVYKQIDGDEEPEHLGTAKISISSLLASSMAGRALFPLEVQQPTGSSGAVQKVTSTGATLHLHAELHKLKSGQEDVRSIPNPSAVGVLIFTLDSVRDLGSRCEDQEVEVELRMSGQSQSRRARAVRLAPQAAGQKQEQLLYLLDGEGKDKIARDKIAWMLGLEEAQVRAIARRSVEARFGHIFRFTVEESSQEVLSMEVRRCRGGKGITTIARYNLRLAELLKQPGKHLPMQERPLESAADKAQLRQNSRVPVFMAGMQWLQCGEALQKEEVNKLVDAEEVSSSRGPRSRGSIKLKDPENSRVRLRTGGFHMPSEEDEKKAPSEDNSGDSDASVGSNS
mmetsp:Transcript_63143/g.150540  ORF Transcript_63143/g.150540 Transcript_63143/m.150540 type:complete len:703 (-) Transcript_63143:100-2208(-)